MKIRITADMPVASEVKPEVGSIHEVIEDKPLDPKSVQSGANHIYFFRNNGTRIGALNFECEVVEP